MKKTFVFIFLLIATVNSFSQTKILLDSSVTIVLPYKYNADQDLFSALHKMNSNIIYAAVIYPSEDDKPSLFAVSKYAQADNISIDSAFNASVKHVPDGAQGGYELVDYRTYKKNDHILRLKESKLIFKDGQEMYNFMYYFMKDGTTDLYELKISGREDALEKNKKMLEEISMTFKFE